MEKRIIKFRAWDNGMFENVLVDGGMWTNNIVEDVWHSGNVMQFTGLLDKNGVEIFEGDVVKCYLNGTEIGNLDVIEFMKGCFALRHRNISVNEFEEHGELFDCEIEIIGNIYANPELITLNK